MEMQNRGCIAQIQQHFNKQIGAVAGHLAPPGIGSAFKFTVGVLVSACD